MSITMSELEILATLKQRWTRLYFTELSRLLRELDRPYLIQSRARPRRRSHDGAPLQRRKRRHLMAERHGGMRTR